MFLFMSFLAVGMFFSSGCAHHTERVGLDEDAGVVDTFASSQDIRTVAQRMASSLLQVPEISSAAQPPRIAFLSVENRSSEIFDSDMMLEKIRTLLLKNARGKLRFLDRAKVKEIIKEREAKRAGIVTTSGSKLLGGADFFLTGIISSIEKQEEKKRSTYTRFSFRLTDAESSDIIWEDEYEIKKVSERATWD